MERPRVFISCGQGSDDELNRANRLKEIVRDAGFEPFVAIEQQSLRGFKEHIVSQLGASEYFLFVDVPREILTAVDGTNSGRRGSLFCQQELAIAAAFELDIAAFVHEEVERRGLLEFVMVNGEKFKDDDHLFNAVRSKIGNWAIDWRIELRWELPPTDLLAHPVTNSAGENETYYNVQVRNRHKSRAAFNCFAYLESCYRWVEGRLEEIRLESIEFAWAGATYANALIQPKQPRLLNVCVQNARGTELCVATTYSGFRPTLENGEYLLNFIVYSQNFLQARGTFSLTVGNQVLRIEPCLTPSPPNSNNSSTPN